MPTSETDPMITPEREGRERPRMRVSAVGGPLERCHTCERCRSHEYAVEWPYWDRGVIDRWRWEGSCGRCGHRWTRDAPELADSPPPPHRRNYGQPL